MPKRKCDFRNDLPCKNGFLNLYLEESTSRQNVLQNVNTATMDRIRRLLPWIILTVLSPATSSDLQEEERARKFLQEMEPEYLQKYYESTVAEWNYATNITDENQQKKLEVAKDYSQFEKHRWQKVVAFDWKSFQDEDLKRQFKILSVLGTSVLSDEKIQRLEKIRSEMESIYSTSKICAYNSTRCDLAADPEIKEIFEKSRNPDELQHTWTQFREVASKKMRALYQEYVELNNEAARLNNFTNAGEYWLNDYEDSNFRKDVLQLWEEMQPLYEQLHAYIRRKLREQYGESWVSRKGKIPAHLLGYLDSESWTNLLPLLLPYPQEPSIDVTPAMQKQKYTPLKVYKVSEDFFTSMNLHPMTPEFWHYSMFEKPIDREVVCHPSAWDFVLGDDVRIKQCTRPIMQDLITAHHEMGHIQYFLQYRKQPLVYRGGANPGFHEAVGDVLALSASTPKHLKILGLLDKDAKVTDESQINHLLKISLRQLPIMAFALSLDTWRWDVFEGRSTEENYNCHYWKLRGHFQGIKPPVERTEEDFDPGAKYHVAAGVPYIRYYVSAVVQFQFHRALCEIAGEFVPGDKSKPLHKCDIYKSDEAGNVLSKMLQMGNSKPWPDAMEVITGQRAMDASALREYFRPLEEWLTEDNRKNGEFIGWEEEVSENSSPETTTTETSTEI